MTTTEHSKPFYAVFAYQANPRYKLAHALGSRVFRSSRGAQAYADKLNADANAYRLTERGYVVRDGIFVHTWGCNIAANGRITMTTPCTCPTLVRPDTDCPYHAFFAAADSGYAEVFEHGKSHELQRD